MNRVTLLCFIIILNIQLIAQSEIGIGQWQGHLPYQQATSLAQSKDKIILSTSLSLLTIDKGDMSVDFISKIDGLSEVGIQKIRYDQFNDQLFVIYTNSNIDILKGADIINVSNIKSNTSIAGNKRINDVYFVNRQQAFFSTDFGIVEFNPEDYNFGSTILTGIGIKNLSSKDDFLFAATSEGIYFVNQQLENNIADFGNWDVIGVEQGLPSLYDAISVITHNNYVYIGLENEIYKSHPSGFSWSSIYVDEELQLEFITPSDDRLISGWRGEDFKNKILFFDDENNFIGNGSNCSGLPLDAMRDESGRVWYADEFSRIRFANTYEESCSQTFYNSPFSEKVSDIALKDDQVIVASGGVAENFTFLFSREGFYYKKGKDWQNFNEIGNNTIKNFDLLNVFKVAIHPSQNIIYAGSYWAGLLEYKQDDDVYTLFNKNNSTLRGAIGDSERERISGLSFDEEENLWVATYNAPEPINVRFPDGQWQSISVPSPGSVTDVKIDRNGYKWFPIDGNNGGILVYDSGPSIQSSADDRFRFIRTSNSEIPSNVVLSVVVDLDGAIWVGTNEGPVIFDCGSDVFSDTECPGVRRKVTQDSIGALLLADQQINVMAVDGANRKWFGTRTGLFVQSPQGETQIEHFTTDNSPLFDNEIRALAFDGSSGVMWIGTNKGLLSYRTETTLGERVHRKSNVYAFPNPVDPNYSGPISIKGLVQDANVKITDINGLLVREIDALGGQAIWDGLDQKGREVSSGVYLVFSSDINAFDRPDAYVTKIMVLR